MPLPKPGSNTLSGNSFLIFITRFFPSLATLLVLIGYSRHLPQNVYGDYQRFWIQLNVMYPLACFGLHVVIITYSPAFVRKLLKQIKPGWIVIYSVWTIAISAVFGSMQDHMLRIGYVVPFLFMLCYSLSIILEAYLIVCRNYTTLIISNLLYGVAFCFVHWYILSHGFYLPQLFTYLFAIVALRLLIYAISAVTGNKNNIGIADDREFSSVTSLWLHLGFYDVTQSLFSWIDKFVVSLVLTASLSAIYFNGSQNIPFLPILLSAAGSAVLMQLVGARREDETANTVLLMKQSGRLLSCVVFPLFFYLLFYRNELIITLLTVKYVAAIPVFAVSILVLPLKAYSFTTVLQRLHKGSIINAGSVADLVLACGLMYPLYCWLGLPGIALSFVISTYLQAAFYLFYTAGLLGVNFFSLLPVANWLIKLIVFAALFIGIRYVGNTCFNAQISLILGSVMMIVTIAVTLFWEIVKQRNYGRS
jgi:O-antigen/teichoic acid export membrane protein